MLPLETELSPEERDRILDRAAEAVARRRMEVPAILALEMHRPLAFLGSQALIVFTPLLGPAFGLERLLTLTALLREPENIDRFADAIENAARELRIGRSGPDAEPAPAGGGAGS